ncbi:MAG TPA: MBL fold metallo-hydrolase [Steroidobacteraceae bacterium]|nr:MBL fold metallo-hydrolase [Steroidobacteraceae bacterium]
MRTPILLAALLCLGVTAAARADVRFAPAEPAARSFHVGALSVTALRDAQIIVANDGKTFGLGVGTDAVGKVLSAAGAPADRITLSANALLVRTGRRLILIDTGLGPRYHGQLLASLKLAGESPGEVTDVLLTHPHPDHIGGLLDAQRQLAFPNATIRMASAAWGWMKQHAPAAMVSSVAPRLRTFEPGARIAPGIRSLSLPGHTPGHVGYEITSGHSRLIDIGDVAHSSIVSLARPQWGIEFDNDRALARATREKELAALAKDGERVFAPHFPFPGVGRIVAAGQGFAWKPGLP